MTIGRQLVTEVLRHSSLNKRLKDTDELSFELSYFDAVDYVAESKRIADLIKSNNFLLETVHPELPNHLVLRFPGIQKHLSTRGKYAISTELIELLNLATAVPLHSETYPIFDPAIDDLANEGSVGDAYLNIACWEKVDPSLENDWVGKFLGLEEIWQTNQGEGITVVQPDTGVAQHNETYGRFDLSRAFDAFNGRIGEAIDPLLASMGNPGHGTSVGSVIASDHHSGGILGIAPKASLVPVRCINSVVLGFDGSLVARALMHAKSINADVLSMSFGGAIRFSSVQEAIKQLVNSGTIVIAAAGNCVGIVVYPASDGNSIAIAGCGADDKPWKGTSHGTSVDLAAPSKNVFAAKRRPDDNNFTTVTPSQGTSYGTAITAGVAALWLVHHGKESIRRFAKDNGTTVNELFRIALKRSARPADTNPWIKDLGAGILDAKSMLNIPLDRLLQHSDVPEQRDIQERLDDPHWVFNQISEHADKATVENGFEWRKHAPELMFLAKEALGRNSANHSHLVESPIPPSPSSYLKGANPPALAGQLITRLAGNNHADLIGSVQSGGADRLFGGLINLRQGGLERNSKTAKQVVESGLEVLTRGGGLESLQRSSETTIARLNEVHGDGAEDRSISLKHGLDAIRELETGQPTSSLKFEHRVGLEALVKMTGRPAFRIREGRVTAEDPMFGDGSWGHLFSGWQDLPRITGAVGRINLGSSHIGTGFLIHKSPNLVMTNRHVLEVLAEEIKTKARSHWVLSDSDPLIDFSDRGDGGNFFKIKRVVFTGDQPTRGRVNLDVLDVAILEIEGKVEDIPTALNLSSDQTPVPKDREMFTIGYPARPSTSALKDPDGKITEEEVANRLGKIFGISYGSKYLSPGEIIEGNGDVVGDNREWAFAHDATTLGGSSGSLVIEIGGDPVVSGIHFAGKVLTRNLAHQITKTGVVEVINAR